MTCVYWIGKPGNIQAVEGQIYGGISHSIGFALSENYDDVKKHSNMFGAGVPYIDDVPDKLVAVDVGGHDPRGPFGSSGASEAFQSSDHMAVINAINNAVGVRIYELPATKERSRLVSMHWLRANLTLTSLLLTSSDRICTMRSKTSGTIQWILQNRKTFSSELWAKKVHAGRMIRKIS